TFFQGMECQSGFPRGAAPAGWVAADISALPPESVGRGSLVMEDPREVSPLSRRVMLPLGAQPVSPRLPLGLRLLSHPVPAALSGRLAMSLPGGLLSERNGLTTFRRCNRNGEVGGVSPPVARHLRARSSEPGNLATYRFGPSLSASLA